MQQLGSKIGVVVAGAAGVGAAYVFNQHQQARKKTNDQRLHAAYATEWHGHAIAPTWLPNHVSPQAWVAQLSDEQKRREAVRKQIAAEAERVRLSLSNAKYKELEAKEQLSHVRSSLQRDANAFAAWQRVEAENAEKIKIELIAVARRQAEVALQSHLDRLNAEHAERVSDVKDAQNKPKALLNTLFPAESSEKSPEK